MEKLSDPKHPLMFIIIFFDCTTTIIRFIFKQVTEEPVLIYAATPDVGSSLRKWPNKLAVIVIGTSYYACSHECCIMFVHF